MSLGAGVLHVINNLGPGGAETQLTALVERSSLANEVVATDDLGTGRRALLTGLWRRLRAHDGPVVAWLDRPQIAVALTAPRRMPLVAAVAGLPRRQEAVGRWTLRLALSRYGTLVFNSAASRDAMAAFAPRLPGDVVLIPNGVDAAPQVNSGGDGPPRVAFIGRDSPDKGLDVLLAALGRFGPDELRGVLVGRGVPEIVAASSLRLSVDAVGRVADPWAEVGRIDALVVPSRSEGSPNVVLEAFVRGVPVVGTTAGGTAELLEDGRGWATAPGDPDALASALRSCLSDPVEARRRAHAASEYAAREHAWDAVVARWDALLLGVAQQPRDLARG